MSESQKSPELRGVRGWLLFLVISLTVLGPLRGAWKVYRDWRDIAEKFPDYVSSDEGAMLQAIAWTVYGTGTTIGITLGTLLMKRFAAETVKIALVGLWIMGPIISICGYLVALAVTEEQPVLSDLRTLIMPALSEILWSAYLMKSLRVKNTYGFNGFFAAGCVVTNENADMVA